VSDARLLVVGVAGWPLILMGWPAGQYAMLSGGHGLHRYSMVKISSASVSSHSVLHLAQKYLSCRDWCSGFEFVL